MRILPLKHRKNGFDYLQILRGRNATVYEQKISKTRSAFEVFVIKIAPQRTLRNRVIEEHERFPHDNASGYWCYTFRSLKKAMKKFNELEFNPKIPKR
jgi:hypothetical protein